MNAQRHLVHIIRAGESSNEAIVEKQRAAEHRNA
jgi:hypothetical protein